MSRKRVLIIEADREFANGLAKGLSAAGYGTLVACDGSEGLDMVRNERPDLVVLCVELPQMSGYSVCNKLKKDGQLKGIPLIIISSEATPETFQQHRKLKTHAEEYMIKPFGADEMVEKAAALIGPAETAAEPAPPEPEPVPGPAPAPEPAPQPKADDEIELSISDEAIVEEAQVGAVSSPELPAAEAAVKLEVPPISDKEAAAVFKEEDLGGLDSAFDRMLEKKEPAPTPPAPPPSAPPVPPALLRENAELREQVESLRRDLGAAKSQAEDSIRKSRPPSPREQEEVARLRNELRNKEKNFREEMDKAHKLDEKVSELIAELGSAHDEIHHLMEQLSNCQKTADDRAASMLQQVAAATAAADASRAEKETAESRLKSIEYLIKKRDDEISQKAGQIRGLEDKVAGLQNEISRLAPFEKDLNQYKLEVESLKGQLTDTVEACRLAEERSRKAQARTKEEAAAREKAAEAAEALVKSLREGPMEG
jgi:DNA-binding response OmpR family regulator/GTP1/Obg family GTP-binding protein